MIFTFILHIYTKKKQHAIIKLIERKNWMNQILITEKLYITPELKRQKSYIKLTL